MKYFRLILILAFSGCCSFNPCHVPKVKAKCCIDFRRPQVMATQAEYVIDYNECCPLLDPEVKGPVELKEKRVTPEMLSPYYPQDSNWVLSSGDTIDIAVWGDPDTAVQDLVIAPDGRLWWSVLPGIEAAGKSIAELRDELQGILKQYYQDPKVVITSKQLAGQGVNVLGRVRAPGFYPIAGPTTLRDAISQAGGLISQSEQDYNSNGYGQGATVRPAYADLDNSFLVRGNEKIKVDFNKVLLEGDASENVYLKAGDYIYLYPNEQRDVFVLGSIFSPQRISYTQNLTLMGALATAGGWPLPGPYSPNLSKVLVIRGALECPCVAQIDVMKILNGEARDFILQPGDIVYAQNKQMRLGRELVYIAIESFVNAFAVGWAGYLADVQWFE